MPDRGGFMQSRLMWLIVGTALVRLAFAWSTGLGVDESYMVAAGRTLSLGYFDHPPASWWLSWGAAHLFGTEAPIAVRLPFILLFALTTWLMARLGTEVADERAGFWAAVLLNLSPVFGVTGGTWVLPDDPLLCALTGAALCLVKATILNTPSWSGLTRPSQANWQKMVGSSPTMTGRAGYWLLTGLCAGLALSAKYSAILTIAGAFLFLAFHTKWLRRPEPYIAALVALLVFSPVVIWNATHHWASFAFQGQRATGLRFHPFAPFTVLLGEALFVLPWIWAPMLAVACKPRPQERLLVWLAAPPIVAFALISAWSSQRILFHWAAPGYLMLFPLLGRAVAERLHVPAVRRTITVTAALIASAVAVIGLQTSTDFASSLTANMRKDPTVEGIDWTSIRTDLTARGLLPPGTIVGVPNWRDGGKIAYALGPDVTVLCLNPDSRQFGFATEAHVGDNMLLIGLAPVTGPFERIEPLPPTSVRHRGRVLQTVSVSLGHRLIAWPPPK